MKRILSLIIAFVFTLTFAACGQSGDTVVDEPIKTPAKKAEPEYKPIESEQYFKHLEKGEVTSCENDPYSNEVTGGGFATSASYVDGTPYSYSGILFDPAMLKGETLVDRDGGSDAPGSGSTSCEFVFTALAAGETEIMLITDNLADSTQECRVFHLTIDENLRCALDFYEDGIMGVNFELCELTEIEPASAQENSFADADEWEAQFLSSVSVSTLPHIIWITPLPSYHDALHVYR